MLKDGKKLRKTRRYSDDFKRNLVKEYESGESTVIELSRRYQIAFQSIYHWIHLYSIYNKKGYILVENSKSKEQALKDALTRIKELEQLVGKKQIELEYLEKLIELADEAYGLDIKKKCSTPPSTGSGPTSK